MQADSRERGSEDKRSRDGEAGKGIDLDAVNRRRRGGDGGIDDAVVLNLRLLLVVDLLAVDVLRVLNSSGLGLDLLLDVEVGSDESGRSPSGDAEGERGRERGRGQQRKGRSCDDASGSRWTKKRKEDSLGEVELVDLIDRKTLGLGDEEEDEDERSGDESGPNWREREGGRRAEGQRKLRVLEWENEICSPKQILGPKFLPSD